MITVTTTSFRHENNRLLYGQLEDRVQHLAFPARFDQPTDYDAIDDVLKRADIVHLHWPEWFLGPDRDRHAEMIELIKRSGTKVIWTQHNLVAHTKDRAYPEIYAMWAAAVDGVIHQSRWGMNESVQTYAFARGARHIVVPRPHNGPLIDESQAPSREAAERKLQLEPVPIRLGIVGAPRAEKLVQVAMDAFARTRREDIHLSVYSLGEDDVVPDDARIHARPYKKVKRQIYDRRLSTIDVFVLPFARSGMLVTGTVGDAIGTGKPAIISDWPFLLELMGGGGICYGQTQEQLTACIDNLTVNDIARARKAVLRRRPALTWTHAADQFGKLAAELVREPT